MDSSYTVVSRNGCHIVFEAVPICDIVALMSAWSNGHKEEHLIGADIAVHLGASVVVGPAKAITDWRKSLAKEMAQRVLDND